MRTEWKAWLGPKIVKTCEFVLVDLCSQRKAIAEYVKGWKPQEVLEWMEQFGTVSDISSAFFDREYYFQSVSGLGAAFRFTENDKLMVMSGFRE